MSLHQKGQPFQFGIPEGMGVFLMLVCVALMGFWRLSEAPRGWQFTTARISSLVEEEGGAFFEVTFYYIVDGRIYHGYARPNRVQRTVFLALPKNLQERLAQRGYVTFDDLPLEVRHVLESRGVLGFEHIPEPLVKELRARGYASEKDIPPPVREVLKSGDSKRIAATLDSLLPVIPTQDLGKATDLGPSDEIRITVDSGGRSLMGIWYDPLQPWIYRVAYLPGLTRHVGLALFLASVAATLAYCVAWYPRLKAQR